MSREFSGQRSKQLLQEKVLEEPANPPEVIQLSSSPSAGAPVNQFSFLMFLKMMENCVLFYKVFKLAQLGNMELSGFSRCSQQFL